MSIKIKFPKAQLECLHCNCKSSLHAVAQLAGKTCVGCDTCPGWSPKPIGKPIAAEAHARKGGK